MLEYIMIGVGIVLLCYVRANMVMEYESDTGSKSLWILTVDILCMLIAMPIVMLMAKVEDIHAERVMRRLNGRRFN